MNNDEIRTTPAIQRNPRAGRGGVEPPVEYRYRPGESGNPAGRPSAGLVIVEWFNQLAGCTEEDYQRIADDKSAAGAKRVAALCWLRSLSVEKTKGGTFVASSEIDRILDRSIGRAVQRMAIVEQRITPDHILPAIVRDADEEDRQSMLELLERIEEKAAARQLPEPHLLPPAGPAGANE